MARTSLLSRLCVWPRTLYGTRLLEEGLGMYWTGELGNEKSLMRDDGVGDVMAGPGKVSFIDRDARK